MEICRQMWILSFGFLSNAAPKLLIFNQRNVAETEEMPCHCVIETILKFKLKLIKLVQLCKPVLVFPLLSYSPPRRFFNRRIFASSQNPLLLSLSLYTYLSFPYRCSNLFLGHGGLDLWRVLRFSPVINLAQSN